ncbi:MAG: FmdB family transcriptional regulator [Desulfobacteraceae bacterium IS3]|nr:MAG: FmdB family transcriptional regulator [Desulfobacteraceae bacterium IS3]HAO21228.1 FmdB family transcriptional regulator [Desulfobacteraceae bacterium]
MPLFDYQCLDCGQASELLAISSEDVLKCRSCGSSNLKKLISTPSSASGPPKNRLPGHGDTGCCGSSPGHGNCAGPGSCCGRA